MKKRKHSCCCGCLPSPVVCLSRRAVFQNCGYCNNLWGQGYERNKKKEKRIHTHGWRTARMSVSIPDKAVFAQNKDRRGTHMMYSLISSGNAKNGFHTLQK